MYGRAGGRSRPPHERDQLIDSARGAASQRECLTNGHRCSPGPRLNRRRWRPAGSGPAWSGGGRVRSAAGATGHTSARDRRRILSARAGGATSTGSRSLGRSWVTWARPGRRRTVRGGRRFCDTPAWAGRVRRLWRGRPCGRVMGTCRTPARRACGRRLRR